MVAAEESQLQVELEQGSGRSADDCTQCFRFIMDGISRLLKRLAKNSFLVPVHVRVAFRALYDGIRIKFPSVDAIQSCTSLFFLRVMCPALLNPPAYGVHADPLQPTALRAMLLVSRILQSSANGQGPSTPFSNIINLNVIASSRIEEFTPILRSFMEGVCELKTIAELTKMQHTPTPKQIKALKRVLRHTRAAMEPPSSPRGAGSTANGKTKNRAGSHPVLPLSHSSPSKPKKTKTKSAKADTISKASGKRARAQTSHDVFNQPDDAASSASTPPASPRPPAGSAFTASSSPSALAPLQEVPSPSKRRIKLNIDAVELNSSGNQRSGADGVSWLVSPRRSSGPPTVEAKRKRLVNRMSTMLPKKSVLDEFDSMKQPS